MKNHTLKDINIDIEYSSDASNLIDDFYLPCLKVSTRYDRAVGYFTSHGLFSISTGLNYFLENEGKIRLIASPALTEDDIEAINKGYRERNEIIEESFTRTITSAFDHLNLLAWLISEKILTIKLAIKLSNSKNIQRGIFHEKIGLFYDHENNGIAFTGSANETIGGLIDNHESIDVYSNWKESVNYFERKKERFTSLWSNSTNYLEVIDFTEATNKILKPYKTAYPSNSINENKAGYSINTKIGIAIPSGIILREYQKQAINNWFQNDGQGIFQMATGTGKTITALSLATTLHNKANLQALIIICPYKHLVDQWANECIKFGFTPLKAYGAVTQWLVKLTTQLTTLTSKVDASLAIITTTSSFTKDPFQNQLKYFPKKTLVIADEVHNMGAKNIRTKLPENIHWKLGLSATPERWFDPLGTSAIFDYFGKIVEPILTLKEALALKVLCPYYYNPILVELTEIEQENYIELSEKIGKLIAMGNDVDEEDSPLQSLLIKRSRLIGSAQNKLSELSILMKNKVNEDHLLVYCGDGTVESEINVNEKKQIDLVCKTLGYDLDMKVSPYTAETSLEERKQLSSNLSAGEIQALVAIRCLDEGVDIPSIKTAIIMASSSNPRQFIQRRGRILRTHPNKDFATIYDMIVVPPKEVIKFETERALFKKELIRFVEFSELSLNQGYARSIILELQKSFDLMDL